MIHFGEIDSKDKQYLIVAVVTPLIVWWVFTGRKKYSAKGMN